MKKNTYAFDPSNVTHLSSQKYTIKIENEIAVWFQHFRDEKFGSNERESVCVSCSVKTEPKPFV